MSATTPCSRGHRSNAASGRVQGFLDSQRGLTSIYAAEGKQVAAAWMNPQPSSPMLVPRTAASVGGECSHVCSEAREPTRRWPSQSDARPALEPEAFRTKSASSQRAESRPSARTGHKRASRDSEAEVEHLKRLAQRRNRGRARRAAMKKSKDTSSEPTSDQENATRSKTPYQKFESKSKAKRAKAVPALLLMQTFSGQKMSKSRLTLKPSKSVGVFNKGKISAKVQTKSQETRGLKSDIVFSESAFLDKNNPSQSIIESSTDDSEDSDAHSEYSIRERNKRYDNEIARKPTGSSSQPVLADCSDSKNGHSSVESVHEGSVRWDVEETVMPLDVDGTSLCSSGSLPSPKPRAAVVGVHKCSWNTKLRKPEECTANPLDTPSFPPARLSDEQRRVISSYFFAPRAPVESLAASPLPLPEYRDAANVTTFGDVPEHVHFSAECSSLPDNPLSHEALASPEVPADYMRVSQAPPTVCYPSLDLLEDAFDNGQFVADIAPANCSYEDGNLGKLSCPESFLSNNHVRNYDRTYLLDVDQDYSNWNDPDSGYGCDPFPGETYDQYRGQRAAFSGDPPHIDEGFYPSLDEYLDCEDLCEQIDTECDPGMPYDSDRYESLDDVAIDQELSGWDEVEENDWLSDHLLSDELEAENLALSDEGIDQPFGATEEPTPSLVHIITEASLETDLLKSISDHWGMAYRLY